ncbi:hypothetical protein CHLNCDRAFT_136402 [Chlorella variabilis]|uniref:Rhodanese domain-containing protein n=1 Tax=Chlorella variabilis TaxID=554065 RepID=E1ZKA2_CHLVA|nr:hypothetical protein CHLNCDRAFT_136402 [Chlorella variabilis]EFN53658.1 hypothetical protein CHLNCDRAFT_136402 [Chlorella variabilis]|eukprot:XP_005845760.1 hypothetical protein CHLNCDRAFT_136402 [Chlorella variabilis]
MASAAVASFQARPCAAFTARRSNSGRRVRRAAALVHAAVKTAGTATSGLEIGGKRPTSPKAWELISTTLKKNGVAFIGLDQAEAAARKGTPIVDVRPDDQYNTGRLPGAVNCQFYQPITGWGPAKIARRVGFTLFGVPGTEANPDFIEQVSAAVPKKSGGMILVCNIGGTLEPTGPSEFGRQSRSLTAAYELVQAGFSNIKVLEGGYNAWARDEREVEMVQ